MPVKRQLWAGNRRGSVASPLPKLWGAGFDTSPMRLDFYTFGDRQGVLQIDTQISNGTVHLGVPQQQLNGTQVASLLVNLRDFGSAH